MDVQRFVVDRTGVERLGCSNFGGTTPRKNCSNAIPPGAGGSVSGNFFRFDHRGAGYGEAYNIWDLSTDGTQFDMWVVRRLPEMFKGFTLYLGDVALPFADAEFRYATSGSVRWTRVRWQLTESLGWSAGDVVKVFVVPPLWTTELTPKSIENGTALGCRNAETTAANRCTTTATLDHDDFSLDGTTFSVTHVSVQNSGEDLVVRFDNPISDALRELTLWVGDSPFRLANAQISASNGLGSATWSSSGLTWTADDDVLLQLRFTPPPATGFDPVGAELVWDSTLTVNELIANVQYGCIQDSATAGNRCRSALTSQTFRVEGSTYRVKNASVFSGLNLAFDFTTDLPEHIEGWGLAVTRTRITGPGTGAVTETKRYTVPSPEGDTINIGPDTPGWLGDGLPGLPSWQAGDTVRITLYRPKADVEREDLLRPGSRSGANCGSLPSPNDNNEESAEVGLWHCHGESVYHRHPDWRKTHRLDDRPVGGTPALTVTADERREGWHYHGSDVYHRHGANPGSHNHQPSDRLVGREVRPAATAPTADDRAAGLTGWHWHTGSEWEGGSTFHKHSTSQHPHRDRVSAPARRAAPHASGWHWHGDIYHEHPGESHPH